MIYFAQRGPLRDPPTIPRTVRIVCDLPVGAEAPDATVVCVASGRVDPAWRAVSIHDTFANAEAAAKLLDPRDGVAVIRLNNDSKALVELILGDARARLLKQLKPSVRTLLTEAEIGKRSRDIAKSWASAAPKVKLV